MSLRTALDFSLATYGLAESGVPLWWRPPESDCDLLIVAGIHGEEPETTVSLSRAARSIPLSELHPGVGWILCANPDGITSGTRGNLNGVDLNRNFPTQNWQAEPVSCRWHADEDIKIPISTGSAPASESETQSLIELISLAKPSRILALHGPLACIDDPDTSPLGRWIAEKSKLPLVSEIGYPTPGSLGTWGAEHGIPVITWEFPPDGIESLSRSQVPILTRLLRGDYPDSTKM